MDHSPAPTNHLSPVKWVVLLVLVCAVVAAGLYAKKLLVDMNGKTRVIATHTCSPDDGNCEVNINGSFVTLSLTKENGSLKTGQAMDAVIQASLLDQKPVQISLKGKTIYMGENHFPLSPVEQNKFASTVHFPVCIYGRMTWQAVIKFDNNNSVIFEFDAE